ncbi:MAG TPA: hypothetical protein VK436_04220 [Methanocella sp.]|nr:hypothetical protein [Methanocella sp.]
MQDATTVNSVSVPLRPDMLEESTLPELQAYTPGKIVEELPQLARRLPD